MACNPGLGLERPAGAHIRTMSGSPDNSDELPSGPDPIERRSAGEPEQLEQALAAAEERLRQAERMREQSAMGLESYRREFEAQLTTYRGQRAWRAMLWLRKAYAVRAEGGVRGLLGWLVSAGSGAPSGVEDEELRFPDAGDYVAEGFDRPFVDEAGASRAAAGDPTYDLLFLAPFAFDFRFQRPQQLAREFARQGRRVFWVSPGRRLPPAASRGFEARPLCENLWEIRLRAPCPDLFEESFSGADADRAAACLEELFETWDVAESATMVELPGWFPVADRLRRGRGSKLVYDSIDDWELMPGITGTRTADRESPATCDLLTASSTALAEKQRQFGDTALLVPNAADFEHFASAQASEELAEIQRPIVGYIGVLAEWFDFDLVAEVARARPNVSFVLIGGIGIEQDPALGPEAAAKRFPALGEPSVREQLSALGQLSNVHLLGHKDYAELPSYLAAFDAAMIPREVSPLIDAMDPVKLYEYFSQGKPVVATPMAELRRFGEAVYTAQGAEEFARRVDEALSEDDSALRERRVTLASTNTWRHRVETFDQGISETFPLVSILIPTYNNAAFVDPCLDSIARCTAYPRYEVLVVDNASGDETRARLRARAEKDSRVLVLPQSENLGFSGALNLAATEAAGEFLLFLNIDTIVTAGWLHRLLEALRTNPDLGAVVPVTNWAANEARINVPYRDRRRMDEFARALARGMKGMLREMDVAPLFCTLVSREVWGEIGELDASFAVGMFEDDDYARRIRNSGRRIASAEDCFVHHFGRASFGALPKPEYRAVFEANRRRYEEKWGEPWKPHQAREGVGPPPSFDVRTFESEQGEGA